MPKKTKKEKILAELRRNSTREDVSKSLSEQPSQQSILQQPKVDDSYRFISKTIHPTPITTSFETNELHAIRKDLMKTLVLSLFAFAGELALYWRWELKP